MRATPLPQPTDIDTAARASGSVFLAIDGYTGPAWEGLDHATVMEVLTLSHSHLATAPRSEAHSRLGAMPEVPVVCATTSGETESVTTSPTGVVEVYVTDDSVDAPPFRLRCAVDGVAVEALYGLLCERLGTPARMESNASA